MPTPHPSRPPSPPPGWVPGEPDESIAARLTGSTDEEVAHCVALLIARHWQPVHDYAVICLASSAPLAAMVTSAAFHQVFDRLTVGEPGVALRPRLLLTVRDTVRLWAAEDRISAALPELHKPAGGRGMRAAASLVPDNRRLAQRSFENLVPAARCLLWHTEVEAEPLDVPAGLLGMDEETAFRTLEEARDKFREGCLRAHRELATGDDCRYYNRLLEAPIRRGGGLLPDVKRHMDDCRYCRDAAAQLGLLENAPGVLLAEAVLGWGARRYYDSRPGRAGQTPRTKGSGRHGGRRPGGGGRGWPLSRFAAQGRRASGGPRSSRALRTGLGLVSASLLATVLGVSLWSHGDGTAPAASTGARDTAHGTDSGTPPDGSATPRFTVPSPSADEIRLRNIAAGLCLAVRDEPKAGAATELAECSSAWNQRWTLEADGLLSSVAAPGLCLDSHADAGVVVLGTCAKAGDERGPDVRYGISAQGELLPRWGEGLALTTAAAQAEADIVVKVDDGTAAQRWSAEPVSVTPGPLSVAGTSAPPTHRPTPPDVTA
ncbi:ricin-type beta-trefoil lectin domain protein [Streptomyces sp. NPDC056188]|uniref:RICIN domain-containing protein n=1 Tax=Streptomyces sp. NPDC056188 TaxID=3345740 RepID=UPI0035E17855